MWLSQSTWFKGILKPLTGKTVIRQPKGNLPVVLSVGWPERFGWNSAGSNLHHFQKIGIKLSDIYRSNRIV
jgi:hypothetical protein